MILAQPLRVRPQLPHATAVVLNGERFCTPTLAPGDRGQHPKTIEAVASKGEEVLASSRQSPGGSRSSSGAQDSACEPWP